MLSLLRTHSSLCVIIMAPQCVAVVVDVQNPPSRYCELWLKIISFKSDESYTQYTSKFVMWLMWADGQILWKSLSSSRWLKDWIKLETMERVNFAIETRHGVFMIEKSENYGAFHSFAPLPSSCWSQISQFHVSSFIRLQESPHRIHINRAIYTENRLCEPRGIMKMIMTFSIKSNFRFAHEEKKLTIALE